MVKSQFVIPQSLIAQADQFPDPRVAVRVGMNGFVPVEAVLSHGFSVSDAALYAQAIYQQPGVRHWVWWSLNQSLQCEICQV